MPASFLSRCLGTSRRTGRGLGSDRFLRHRIQECHQFRRGEDGSQANPISPPCLNDRTAGEQPASRLALGTRAVRATPWPARGSGHDTRPRQRW